MERPECIMKNFVNHRIKWNVCLRAMRNLECIGDMSSVNLKLLNQKNVQPILNGVTTKYRRTVQMSSVNAQR
jgi:hypothetical protein